MTTQQRLVNYFRASFFGVAIQTTEEARAMAEVMAAAKECGRAIYTWSASQGMLQAFPDVREIQDTSDLTPALMQRFKKSVIVFRDIHTWPFDRDPRMLRELRDLLEWAPSEESCVVILGHEFKPHPTYEKMVTVIDYSLPSVEDLGRISKAIGEAASLKDLGGGDVIRALGGLSTTEAQNALSLSYVETDRFDPAVIYREKVQAVKKSGLLSIMDPDPKGLDSIGGLENLKEWVLKRKRAFTPEAVEYGLPAPKGILIVGVPGTGKSLSGKAIGTALGVPTLRMDIGALFNSLVGESESRARDALKLAEAMSPCVLMLDEIDKGLAGASGSGSGDSGVTKRVFGTILSWMQERRRPVFLVATANQVEGLPPELLRKGRFDEIFAVDLPNAEERRAIFSLHLIKRGRAYLASEVLAAVVEVTNGFTGSEIENVIEEAMFNAFAEARDISLTDMVNAAKATTPLSVTMKEQVQAIRDWAKTRARFASRPESKQATQGQRKLTRNE